MLAPEFENLDPTRETDDCLSVDEMFDLDLSTDTEATRHFRRCARCQMVYHEAVALSLAPATTSHGQSTTAPFGFSLFQGRLRIAASWAAFILVSGIRGALLGAESDELAGEIIIEEGPLAGATARFRPQRRELVLEDLPADVDRARLRLSIDDTVLSPASVTEDRIIFELADHWVDGERSLELILADEGE